MNFWKFLRESLGQKCSVPHAALLMGGSKLYLVYIYGFGITCTSLLSFGRKIAAGSGRWKILKRPKNTSLPSFRSAQCAFESTSGRMNFWRATRTFFSSWIFHHVSNIHNFPMSHQDPDLDLGKASKIQFPQFRCAFSSHAPLLLEITFSQFYPLDSNFYDVITFAWCNYDVIKGKWAC